MEPWASAVPSAAEEADGARHSVVGMILRQLRWRRRMQGSPFAIRKGRSDVRREIVGAEGSRSSAPGLRLWGERAGDRPIGRDRPLHDRGVYPPRCGGRLRERMTDARLSQAPRGHRPITRCTSARASSQAILSLSRSASRARDKAATAVSIGSHTSTSVSSAAAIELWQHSSPGFCH
jgi:hypothetical protein